MPSPLCFMVIPLHLLIESGGLLPPREWSDRFPSASPANDLRFVASTLDADGADGAGSDRGQRQLSAQINRRSAVVSVESMQKHARIAFKPKKVAKVFNTQQIIEALICNQASG